MMIILNAPSAWRGVSLEIPRPHRLRPLKAVLVEQQGAGVDHRRVIPLAAMVVDLLQRHIHAQGRPIGAVRVDRLHHIRHRQDACLDDQRLPPNPPWVATAVDPLMVLQHHLAIGQGKRTALTMSYPTWQWDLISSNSASLSVPGRLRISAGV